MNREPIPSPADAITAYGVGDDVSCMHAEMERKGVVILENLFPPSLVEQVNAEITPVLMGPALGLNDAEVVREGRRMNSSLRHSPSIAAEVVAHPTLVGLTEALLLPHADTIQISATQVAEIGPREAAQVLHRDDYTWGHIKGRTHPLSVVAIIALSEFTPEYGATRVIPGSHLWDDALAPSTSGRWTDGVYVEKSYPPGLYEDRVVQPTLAPGSALMFLGTTAHGAGANTSHDVYRRALVIQYCVGWVRAAQNNFLLYPPSVAKSMPLNVQRLLGYQLEARHCGQLEQGVDPIVLLRE